MYQANEKDKLKSRSCYTRSIINEYCHIKINNKKLIFDTYLHTYFLIVVRHELLMDKTMFFIIIIIEGILCLYLSNIVDKKI